VKPAPDAPDTAQLLLWGMPELHAGDTVTPFGRERRHQLLALLALSEGQWVSRDHIGSLLWPDHTTAQARGNLRKVVFMARAVPGVARLDATDDALRWQVATDLQAFRKDVHTDRGSPATLALRRGRLLQGMDDPLNTPLSDWIAVERTRADQAWRAVAQHCLQVTTDPSARACIAGHMLQVDALDEVALAALLSAEVALGRRAEALAAYTRYTTRLHAELGLAPSEHLQNLTRTSGVPTTPADPPPRCTGPSDAAVRQSAFVGRRVELAELQRLLSRPACRLLTLLGPGGIGKSRLARQALAPLTGQFEGGVEWIELQDLRQASAVTARLAQVMGILGDARGDPVLALCGAVPKASTLWVLDNAEHLADLAPLLDRLLAGAPSLSLLVTSRQRLQLDNEWVLPLTGLAVPDDQSLDLEAASTFDAVKLFDVRACGAQPGFSLARHLPAVTEVVGLVAGMPLAIELAAAWVRLLPPSRIAADLRSSLDLLASAPAPHTPHARPEHASLRLVLEKSWSLLTAHEQAALSALAVFQGGFSHEAARTVATCSLPLLAALADKSMVAVDEEGRFGLHPMVAAFASERLTEDPLRTARLRERHAEHCCALLASLAPHAIGDPRLLVAGIEAEFANLAQAWRYAVGQQRTDWVAIMVRALWSYFENRGRQREGLALLGPALALEAETASGRHAQARVRHGLSMLCHRIGDDVRALQLARSGTLLAADGPDTEAWVGCVLNAGTCLWNDGDVQAATERFEAGVAISRQRGDRQCLAWSLGNLSVAHSAAGRFDEAHYCLLQALEGSREVGDQYNVGVHLHNLGTLASSRLDHLDMAAGRRWYEQSLAHAQAFGIVSVGLFSTVALATVARRSGDAAGARARYEEVAREGRRNGLLAVVETAEQGLTRLDMAAHDAAGALRRLQRLAQSARVRDNHRDLAVALMIYAEWLREQGRPDAATQACRGVLQSQVLEAALCATTQSLLDSLPALAAPAQAIPSLQALAEDLMRG
jgi:predicted ATPase/DNA-binding SARP family transcriptional activator